MALKILDNHFCDIISPQIFNDNYFFFIVVTWQFDVLPFNSMRGKNLNVIVHLEKNMYITLILSNTKISSKESYLK